MRRDPKEHLTEDEFIQFVLEDVPEDVAESIDQHLESCVACAKELENFYKAQETFPYEKWAMQRPTFVETLKERVFPWERLRKFLQWFSEELSKLYLAPAPQYHPGKPQPLDLKSEKDEFRGYAEKNNLGAMEVYFDSSEMALAGKDLRFSTRDGSWQQMFHLDDNDDEVSTKVVIPSGLGKEIQVEFVNDEHITDDSI